MILVGIIAAKSKPFVVHLNVLSYNNCPSIGRYLFLNPVRYIYIYCARSLEFSSSSTLAGLSYHICGKLEVAFIASPSSQHQHCTDEAQKAETVLSAVSYIYIYIYIYNLHERGSSSNKETLYFRPDAFRLLPSSGVFALRLITYD